MILNNTSNKIDFTNSEYGNTTMLETIISSNDSYEEKINQAVDLIAEELSTGLYNNKSYIEYVEDHLDQLISLVGKGKHQYDEIGRITSQAVIAKQLIYINSQLDNIEAEIASSKDNAVIAKLEIQKGKLFDKKVYQEKYLELSNKILDFIIENNIANVVTEEKIYSQSYNEKQGTKFTPVREKIFFDSNPRLFCKQHGERIEDIERQKLFRILLEHTRRHKETTTVTFKECPIEQYNQAPNPDKWVKPIFGESHHEFFDILFKSVAPDPLARKNILDSLAFKLTYPHLNRLPSPVFVGTGGTGKTGLGILFETIAGVDCVNWKAKISDDTMKNTGSLFTGKIFVNFDEMKQIHMNSPDYVFVKDICHTDVIKTRNINTKMSTIENSTWIWFSGNPSSDRSPVPLLGEKNSSGVDRRFTPIISRKTLVDIVSEDKNISKDDAEKWINTCFATIVTNKYQVAKFIGNIITDSNVLNLTEHDYPRAYHGPDYFALSTKHASQIDIIAEYISICKPEFLNLNDAFKAYTLMCDNDNVDKKYRKQKTGFSDSLTGLLKVYFPDSSYGRFNIKTGGQSVGWKMDSKAGNPFNDFKLTRTDEMNRSFINKDHYSLLNMDADLIDKPVESKPAIDLVSIMEEPEDQDTLLFQDLFKDVEHIRRETFNQFI